MTMLALIILLGNNNFKYNRDQEESTKTWTLSQSVELLAIMENEMVQQRRDSSQTSTDDNMDYTNLFPELYTVYNIPPVSEYGSKRIYLTFDDGPSKNTYRILDILEKLDIKATFFIVGGNITDEYEDCLKRMINEGHTIGIHCYSHVCRDLYCSVERFLEDFNEVYQKIYEVTGERVNIYRFPWGSSNPYNKKIKDTIIDELERRGFTCYDWTTSADDSIGKPTPYSMKKNIKKDLKLSDHPIVLMHDGASNKLTPKTLPEIIKMLQEYGYEFDTLDNRKPYLFPW